MKSLYGAILLSGNERAQPYWKGWVSLIESVLIAFPCVPRDIFLISHIPPGVVCLCREGQG